MIWGFRAPHSSLSTLKRAPTACAAHSKRLDGWCLQLLARDTLCSSRAVQGPSNTLKSCRAPDRSGILMRWRPRAFETLSPRCCSPTVYEKGCPGVPAKGMCTIYQTQYFISFQLRSPGYRFILLQDRKFIEAKYPTNIQSNFGKQNDRVPHRHSGTKPVYKPA